MLGILKSRASALNREDVAFSPPQRFSPRKCRGVLAAIAAAAAVFIVTGVVGIAVGASAALAAVVAETRTPGGDRWCRGGAFTRPVRPPLRVLPLALRALRVG